jgi:sister chromatid cohesion protein DCC1
VPDGYHVDIKMLAVSNRYNVIVSLLLIFIHMGCQGLCITEEDATFNQSDNTYTLLEYVPAEQLPFEPAARIRALFEIRPRWRGEALRTYLNELAVYPEDVDGWLMKYTRRINSGGAPRRGKRKADGTGVDDVWYCARVMGGH